MQCGIGGMFKNSVDTTKKSTMSMKTPIVKVEPVLQNRVQQLAEDGNNSAVVIKERAICKEEIDINWEENDENDENVKSNSNSISNQAIVTINGVVYVAKSLPASIRTLIQNAVPNALSQADNTSAICQKCGKTFKHKKMLYLHKEVCERNLVFHCKICPYENTSKYLLKNHQKIHAKTFLNHYCELCAYKTQNRNELVQHVIDNHSNIDIFKFKNMGKGDFVAFCVNCNIATTSMSKLCIKCGSLNRWLCKLCNLHFKTYTKICHHYNSKKCRPSGYYHCLKCDHKSAFRNSSLLHFETNHPQVNLRDSLEYIEWKDVATDRDEAVHKTNKTDKDFASGIRKFIIYHCQTCKKDITFGEDHISVKLCSYCQSNLMYKCMKCNTFEKDYNSIEHHCKAVCYQLKEFKCLQCDFLAFDMSQMNEHKKIHGDISATCTSCGKCFSNSASYKRHIKFCGLKPKFQCDMCSFRTKTKCQLQKHVIRRHNDPSSEVAWKTRFSRIRQHIECYCMKCNRRQFDRCPTKFCKVCNTSLHFRCKTCHETFALGDMNTCEHVKIYVACLDTMKYECKVCGKMYVGLYEFKLHAELCGQNTSYGCELCTYTTENITDFRKHRLQVHQIKLNKKCLGKMYRAQSEENVFQCHYCSYASTTKSDITTHMKIHFEQKNNAMSSPMKDTLNERFVLDENSDIKKELNFESMPSTNEYNAAIASQDEFLLHKEIEIAWNEYSDHPEITNENFILNTLFDENLAISNDASYLQGTSIFQYSSTVDKNFNPSVDAACLESNKVLESKEKDQRCPVSRELLDNCSCNKCSCVTLNKILMTYHNETAHIPKGGSHLKKECESEASSTVPMEKPSLPETIIYSCPKCTYEYQQPFMLKFHMQLMHSIGPKIIKIEDKVPGPQMRLNSNNSLFNQRVENIPGKNDQRIMIFIPSKMLPYKNDNDKAIKTENTIQINNSQITFDEVTKFCPKCKISAELTIQDECHKCRSKIMLYLKKHHADMSEQLEPVGKPESIEYGALQTKTNGFEDLAIDCSKCGNQFKHSDDFNRHSDSCYTTHNVFEEIDQKVEENRDDEKYIVQYCKECNKYIELEDCVIDILKSCKDCSRTLIYECRKCKKLGENYTDLLLHSKTACHPQKLLNCTKCDYTAHFKSEITKHFEQVHVEFCETCTNCKDNFTNSVEFKRHLINCEAPLEFLCNDCLFTTKTKASLRKHIRLIHMKPSSVNTNALSPSLNLSNSAFVKEEFDFRIESSDSNPQSNLYTNNTNKNKDVQEQRVHFIEDISLQLSLECRVLLTRLRVVPVDPNDM